MRTPGGYAAVPVEDFLAQVQGLPLEAVAKLARSGRADAQIQLARLRWSDGDTLTPIDTLRPHAEAGVPVAQYLLGSFLRFRNRDLPGALKWISAAAKQGHPLAQEALAGAHEAGSLALPPSPQEAFRLYLAAGKAGLWHSQMKVALYLCSDRVGPPQKALGAAWLVNSQQSELVPFSPAAAGCE
ncbi:MAG: sel1 repeat family protein [Rubrivivax sp.]|nr:MAG: sel1 repeat family protein [Rubrivivax sp.]